MAGNREISFLDLKQNAHKANQKLQERVNRWMWTRSGLSLLFLIIGFAVWFLPQNGEYFISLFAFPLWMGALIFFLMAMDAYQRSREVEGRHWTSCTPRVRRPPATSTECEQLVEEQD